MVADRDDVRKPPLEVIDFRKISWMTSVRNLASSGLPQINLEVQQLAILFEGHDFGNVQVGAA